LTKRNQTDKVRAEMSATNEPRQSSYDKVLYPSYTRIQTHPDRLATIATLFGMTPAPVERCRMLELGCGNVCRD
jgi:hypothetical protein